MRDHLPVQNEIDPIYCRAMFKQALYSVLHGKVHGYGSDFLGNAERAWAHAQIARENIAIALTEMVEQDHFSLDDAEEVAFRLYANQLGFYDMDMAYILEPGDIRLMGGTSSEHLPLSDVVEITGERVDIQEEKVFFRYVCIQLK